jgi:hypothetical protein
MTMIRLLAALAVAGTIAGAGAIGAAAAPQSDSPIVTLFNGKDLDGWDSDLASAEKGKPALGRNNDPLKVFSAVTEDGEPAIRVSGQVMGGLSTRREFSNYVLRLQFKWGTKRWPPRENSVRDSGVLYHCVGAPSPATGWMQSAECQVEEQDCGDFWAVQGVRADANTIRMDTTDEQRRQFEVWAKRNEGNYPPFAYRKGGERMTVHGDGLMKSGDAEKPTGQWNDIDIYCLGETAVHVVNGKAVMVLHNLRRPAQGKEVPMNSGRVQLQSEGAEVFFRKLTIEPLTRIPGGLLE